MRIDHLNVKHRTIALPGDRSKQIETAAKYLGITGEELIQRAIAAHLRAVFGRIALESSQIGV